MSKFIVGAPSNDVFQALHDAGVFKEEPDYVRRVIIDLQVGAPARIYVDLFADSRLTDVLMQGGIEIIASEAEVPA